VPGKVSGNAICNMDTISFFAISLLIAQGNSECTSVPKQVWDQEVTCLPAGKQPQMNQKLAT
jgi:hypothetical protein